MNILEKLREEREAYNYLINLLEKKDYFNLMKSFHPEKYKTFLLQSTITEQLIKEIVEYLNTKSKIVRFKEDYLDILMYIDDEKVGKILLFDGTYVLFQWLEEIDFRQFRWEEMEYNTVKYIEDEYAQKQKGFKNKWKSKKKQQEEQKKKDTQLKNLNDEEMKQRERMKNQIERTKTAKEELFQIGFLSPFYKSNWFRLMRHSNGHQSEIIASNFYTMTHFLNVKLGNVVALHKTDMENHPDYKKHLKLVFTIPKSIFTENDNIEIIDIEFDEYSTKRNIELKKHYNKYNDFNNASHMIRYVFFKMDGFKYYINNTGFILSDKEGIKHIKSLSQ